MKVTKNKAGFFDFDITIPIFGNHNIHKEFLLTRQQALELKKELDEALKDE